MRESVFKPSRIRDGKRVKSDYYYGRYSLPPSPKIHQVPLGTPDKEIARKRLRELVIEAQREQEGLIAPKAIRQAAQMSLADLIFEYQSDLKGRGLAATHVRDTVRRLTRLANEASWRVLSDVRADSFVRWRASLTCSAKTSKEYQVSACAFLNWLVRTDRLERNPLGRVDRIDTRGKQVRESRAFTEEELRRLFSVAGRRLPAYLILTYTGQRREEVRSLVWGDLHLNNDAPYVLIRESTTKDKDKRAIPLHTSLANTLRAMRPADANDTDSVFFGRFPTYESLRKDLVRAGIPHKDALGRVVHFHAFRKTWQTLGVRYQVNQRAAQEILGHSDPALTAKAYTDVAALSLHTEVAKLPWLAAQENDAPNYAPPAGVQVQLPAPLVTQGDQPQTTQTAEHGALCHFLSYCDIPSAGGKMVVGSGFEPEKGDAQEIYSLSSLAT